MLNPKITEAIQSQLTKERFLFWYDTDKEYVACVKELTIVNTKILMVDEVPALAIKLEIAESEQHQKFLFYTTKQQPEAKSDWLLSYRLKGKTFSADQTQILMDELGLSAHVLRPHLKLRSKFLAAKDRVERLKRWTNASDATPNAIDLKILTVIARSDQAEPFSIFNRVLSDLVQDEKLVPDASSRIWNDIKQYQLEEVFWDLAKSNFGYQAEHPSLKNLMMCLLITDMAFSLKDASLLPQQLQHFALNDTVKKANAKVFISRWRSDVTLMPAYIVMTQALAEEMHIDKLIHHLPDEALLSVHTFSDVEKTILSALKQKIIKGGFAPDLNDMIKSRRDGFWANTKITKDVELTHAYAACYDAIEAANAFNHLKEQFSSGFSFSNAKEGLESYQSTLFRFDQTYRHFHFAASKVEHLGWGLLRDLVEHVENAYSGWFIPQLSSAWDKVIDGKQGLINDWQVEGWTNQYRFFERYVNSVLSAGLKRVYVLISDAFRFEAAEELMQQLNARNKFQANIEGMLGVLPSYTSLGMAALLPHQSLKYKRGQTLSVLADDLPTSGLEQRSAVLSQYQGVAIKHEELLALGKEDARDFIKPYQVVYIYHDRVDAIGDKQSTETKTFEAVAQSIDELAKVIGFVFNNLGASTVYLTADHGFMYQESALESADKSNLIDKPANAYVTKKRYLIGDKLGETAQAWYGNTEKTAGTAAGEASLDFWVPKGASRFHFTGGARFVHGSAMPQEIVVPVLTIKQLESEKGKTKLVEMAILGTVTKFVTNMQKFEIIQTEPVSEYVLARTVKICMLDGQNLISDEHIMTIDNASSSLDDRKVSLIITLKAGEYDRFKDYHFSIRDIESGVELVRHPMRIDLAFSNDF